MPAAAADITQAAELIAEYVLEDHIGFHIRRAHQRHASLFNELIGDSDLTPTQFAALLRTVQIGRVTQNHLGRLTAMDPATIQGVVRRLIERGFILRDIDPLDRRSLVLVPTQTAIDKIAMAIPAVRHIADALLSKLTVSEHAELVRLLRKLS